MVELLRAAPRRAGALSEELGVTPAALSRHLRMLRKSGLVTEDISEQDARVRIYRLLPAPFEELRTWVEDIESFWGEQLAAFKAHAEGRKK